MAIEPGSSLLHYRLVEQIGEGGMGVVWKAVDTTLDREVAIKILPDAFASDPERLARFEREAKLLASLNHPNIASVYGLHEAEGIRFLAMEYVPGEDLKEHLGGGASTSGASASSQPGGSSVTRSTPFPLDEALGIARLVADALDAAHEQGIVHRDLKPANVKRTPEGRIKVLDFGLAKALVPEAASGGSDPSASATATTGGTRTGMVLGTAAYMAPEQARGRAVDRRTDIWALGCLVYEMLTGRRAFDGETMSDTIAAVLTAEPEWGALGSGVTPEMIEVLRGCLEKDPRRRYRTAGDVTLMLTRAAESAERSGVGAGGGQPGAAAGASAGKGRALGWSAALLLIAAALIVGLAVGYLVTGGDDDVNSERVIDRLAIVEPDLIWTSSISLSRDGRRLVFVVERDEGNMIAVRDLARFDPVVLQGTEGAINPFFSPDGEWVGYFTLHRLLKVPVAGGNPRTICDIRGLVRFDPWNAGDYPTATWGPDGTIVFNSGFWREPSELPGLYRVPAGGGTPQPLTQMEGNYLSHETPKFLPDGKHVVFTARKEGVEVLRAEVINLASGERREIMENAATVTILPSGFMIFLDDFYRRLNGVRFDLERMEVTGPAVPLVEALNIATTVAYSVADDGTLVYVHSGGVGGQRTIARITLDGSMSTINDRQADWTQPQISPDGRSVVIREIGAQCRLWVLDLQRNVLRPLTHEGDNHQPIWSRDGRSITYGRFDGSESGRIIYRQAADGSSPPEPLVGGQTPYYPLSFGPGDRELMFEMATIETGVDMWILPLDGGEPRPFLVTEAFETEGTFSPDGRWVAYTSDESGRQEVYVQAYPGPGALVQVSRDGGHGPVWAPDGKTIYFAQGSRMMAASFDGEGAEPVVQRPDELFRDSYVRTGRVRYDLMPDGKSFIVVPSTESGVWEMRVVTGWVDELRELVPEG